MALSNLYWSWLLGNELQEADKNRQFFGPCGNGLLLEGDLRLLSANFVLSAAK
jgi:hypothetical protein